MLEYFLKYSFKPKSGLLKPVLANVTLSWDRSRFLLAVIGRKMTSHAQKQKIQQQPLCPCLQRLHPPLPFLQPVRGLSSQQISITYSYNMKVFKEIIFNPIESYDLNFSHNYQNHFSATM